MTDQKQLELAPHQATIGIGIALLVLGAIGGGLFLLASNNRGAATADATALVARLAAGPITEGIATPSKTPELLPDAMGGGVAPDGPFLAGYREIRTEVDGSLGKKNFSTAVDYHALVPFQLATDRGPITVGPAALDGDLSGCPGKSTDDAHVRVVKAGARVAMLGGGAHVELHCGDAAGWQASARDAVDQPLSTLGFAGMIVAIAGGLGGLLQIVRGMRQKPKSPA